MRERYFLADMRGLVGRGRVLDRAGGRGGSRLQRRHELRS
jgi:hypothetical protein